MYDRGSVFHVMFGRRTSLSHFPIPLDDAIKHRKSGGGEGVGALFPAKMSSFDFSSHGLIYSGKTTQPATAGPACELDRRKKEKKRKEKRD